MTIETQRALLITGLWAVLAVGLLIAVRGRGETVAAVAKRWDLPIGVWLLGGLLFASGSWRAMVLVYGMALALGTVAVVGTRGRRQEHVPARAGVR